MEILQEISAFLQKGRAKNVEQLVQDALDQGISAKVILDEALLGGLGIIGEKFKKDEVFVPEVLVAARAMNKGIEILKPYLGEEGSQSNGKVVLGTVKGDLHDIGKNLVKIMLEGKGIEVIDLGIDVSAETFVEEAKKNQAKVILCSALLTTTMPEMKKVVDLIKNQNLDIKVMVGGAPVNQDFCDEIGADYYTDDAASAADIAYKIVKG